ncbi:MAG TPA: ABC transporter permease [Kofleriaceae bacterium]|nr:ABC transporter permease [Kofleriaceae bacterium]
MSLVADVRFALRMMVKNLGVTAVLILTLGLGIGASTTIFSVVDSVVIKALPYPDSDRLVRLYSEFLPESGEGALHKFWISPPEYKVLTQECTSCASIGAYGLRSASIGGGDRPVRVPSVYATASLLPTIGVAPELGRWYSADEDKPGDPTAIVIGHDLWKDTFGGEADIIGKKVTWNAIPVTIVGVMPAGFDFPGPGTQVWVPARIKYDQDDWGSHNWNVIARLEDGVSIAQARSELDTIVEHLSKEGGPKIHRPDPKHHPLEMFWLKDEVVGSLSVTLWLLQAAVLFVLLIAVANLSNLLLARAEARGREIAVRQAIGATRRRLVRQFLTESVVLGLAGGALGILIAVWALDATVALLPSSAPRLHEIHLDTRALGFALACTLAASFVFGLAPILHTRVDDLHGALKDGSLRTSGTRSQRRLRRALVVSEVSLAVVLVIGCGMMIRSFMRLQQVDLGMKPDHVLTMQLQLHHKTYSNAQQSNAFWRRLEDKIRALPGVESMTLLDGTPPERPIIANDIAFPGKVEDKKGAPWNVDYWQPVGDDALPTLGIKLVSGRALAPSDDESAPPVVMINRAFARKFFPGEDPLGKEIWLTPWNDKSPHQRIVGVVDDVKNGGLDKPAGTEVYFNLWQVGQVDTDGFNQMTVAVRTSGDPMALAPAVQRAIAELDPTLPVSKVQSMDGVLWEAVARPRFLMFLLGAFAVLALVLAAVGIYGVMSYTVAQRTHEIGIRMALGATPKSVRWMVLRQAGGLTVVGVVIGLVAATIVSYALGAELSSMMFESERVEPITFALVGLVVIAASLVASYVPARRATRVQPTVALRSE